MVHHQRSALSYLCFALHFMMLAPSNDPDTLAIAKVLRDAVEPLKDMIDNGEGELTIKATNGRMLLGARTPNYDVLQRVE